MKDMPETITDDMVLINGMYHKIGLNGHAYYWLHGGWVRSSKPAYLVTQAIEAAKTAPSKLKYKVNMKPNTHTVEDSAKQTKISKHFTDAR